jgi:Tol biopolymer transport system component
MNGRIMLAGLAVGVLVLAVATPRAQKTTADALFREALVKERAEGTLKEAVFRYERIIADFGKERQVAGQAMYQLALIYQKLGDPRATVLLTRLTRDYASVEPFAGRAREKLQALQAEAAGPFRSVTTDPAYELGSPDGKLVIYHKEGKDWGRRLFVKDLASGGERVLVELTAGTVNNCVWSPDGRRLACNVSDRDGKMEDVRFVDLESGAMSDPGIRGYLRSWTATGELFYGLLNKQTVSTDWYLVPAGGGSARRVLADASQKPVMTPDATRLIVSASKKLHVRDLATGNTQPLTTGTGEEYRPIASPDGRLVAFLANPDGRWAPYVAPLDRGLPVRNPVRLGRADEDAAQSGEFLWWTRGGQLIFGVSYSEEHLFRVDMDPETGRATDAPRRLTQDAPMNWLPTLSPDGQHVAYLYKRAFKYGVAVMDSDGANERPLNEEAVVLRPAWRSSDEILFRRMKAADGGPPLAIVGLDIKTGAVEPCAQPEGLFWWSVPARREILHMSPQGGGPAPGATLKAWLLTDRRDRVIAQIDYLYALLAMTPDGRRIAYTTSRPVAGTDQRVSELAVMTGEGKLEAVLLSAQPQTAIPLAFSPDGRYLLYSQRGIDPRVMNVASRESWPLYQGPGDSRFWQTSPPAASWSPDGRFIIIGRAEPERREFLAWEGVTADAVATLMERAAPTLKKEPR